MPGRIGFHGSTIMIPAPDRGGYIRPVNIGNEEIARQFRRAAELLEAQHADPFRVNAYHRAASTVEAMDEAVVDIYDRRGVSGLIELPTIGKAFALAIADIVTDGRWRWLERLQGAVDPESVLMTVAGIGPRLAARVHHEIGVETLEGLEIAAHDGRLAAVDGFGPKRVRAVVDSLAGHLRPVRPTRGGAVTGEEMPAISELLDIDDEYRSKAHDDALPTIAPSRFNPTHASWLPVLHTTRGDRRYTAMFSNTAKAHELGRIDDWVVIYADGPVDGQWTVVTESRGPRAGQRVVRGGR